MELRHRGERKREEIINETLEEEDIAPNEESDRNQEEPTDSKEITRPSLNLYSLIFDFLSSAFSYVYETFSAYIPLYEPQLDLNIK
jgi:hypothetical protein